MLNDVEIRNLLGISSSIIGSLSSSPSHSPTNYGYPSGSPLTFRNEYPLNLNFVINNDALCSHADVHQHILFRETFSILHVITRSRFILRIICVVMQVELLFSPFEYCFIHSASWRRTF